MTDPVDLEQAERDAASEAETAADDVVDRQALIDNDEADGPTANEYSIAFSPRNVAVLVAFAARRHRRRGRGDREDG
jgi:hypothetical protein